MEIALPNAVAGPAAAPELDFAITDGGVLDHAAVPTLRFALAVSARRGAAVRSVALAVEVRIAATRRRYDDAERERLVDLFGQPADWGRNLHALHWTSLSVHVPPFAGSTVVELPVTCTYDLEVTAARYFDALAGGNVPLEFLFSGTVFYADAGGRLQIGRVGWDREARFLLPVAAWRELIERHFPGTGWLRLRRDRLDRLSAYRARHTLLTWDDAIDRLLREAGE